VPTSRRASFNITWGIMRRISIGLVFCLGVQLTALGLGSAATSPRAFEPFTLSLDPGQHFVGKTTLVYASSAGSTPVTIRGTYDLTIVKRSGSRLVIQSTGRVANNAINQSMEFDPNTFEQFVEGKRQPRTSLSFFFDPASWGTPPSDLSVGAHWQAPLRDPWDYGPPGNQQVRVVAIDRANNSITLERTGEGLGPSRPQLEHGSKLAMSVQGQQHDVDVTYQKSRWVDRAVIRDGIMLTNSLRLDQEYLVPTVDILPAHKVSTHTDVTMTVST
jgi:hypothetical protein